MAPAFCSLLLLGILGMSWAQRAVTLQQGPLYRTVGTHISIWCRVSGYQGPSRQEFLWSVYRPSSPERELQVVSTARSDFTYAVYADRVQSGDIYVDRLAGDHTLLHIRQLQEMDTGEYECFTPGTETPLYGTYSGRVNLSVIPDTLEVKMSPQALRKTEGDPLQLFCDVSTASSQHTHLSVTWHLTSESETQIISLSRDFVLLPGPSYTERFSSGDVRLDKLGNTTYRLSIQALQTSDQGQISCRASEWIQDPDGTWTDIKGKESEETKVVVSSGKWQDFEVHVQAPDTALALGSPLEIVCSITAQDVASRPFHVIWLLNKTVVVTWNPSGIPSFEKPYEAREVKGQLAVGRRSLGTWYLRIGNARMEDGGSYNCEVTEKDRDVAGTLKTRVSSPVSVTVKQTESNPQVRLSSDVSQVYEGDSVRFTCELMGVSGPVSVTWYMIGPSGLLVEMASLQRDGELTVGQSYTQRHSAGHLRAEKLGPGLFSLTLGMVMDTEDGRYRCQVTEWVQEPEGGWSSMSIQKQDRQINVKLLRPSLTATLSTRTAQVIAGGTLTLFCRVSAAYRLSDRTLFWSWQFLPQSDPTGRYQKLVHVSQNVSWGDSLPGFQGKAQLWISGESSTLRVYKAQRGQAGQYRCEVRVLDRETGVPQASASSNALMVLITAPESRLTVDPSHRVLELGSGHDQLTVTCRILTRTAGAHYGVSWFFLPPAAASSPLEILNVSREGVLSYSPASFSPAQTSRFLSERASADTYLLRVLRPDSRQRGGFRCTVQEWLWEEGDAWSKLAEKNSGVTTVQFKLSENNLNIPKNNISAVVTETEDVVLRCPLGVVPSSGSLFSVSWYYRGAGSPGPDLIYRAGWEGVTEYKESLARRLHPVATSRGNYSLFLQSAGQEDAGTYHCQAEEWRLEAAGGNWRMEASDESGYMELTVTAQDVSQICSSRSLFHILLIYPLLLLLPLLAALAWLYMRGRRDRRSAKHLKGPGQLWSIKKVSEIPMKSVIETEEEEEGWVEEKERD